MPEPVFPHVDRVVYGKAPLVEVVCQARFPVDLRIEVENPVEFQQRVRDLFPLLSHRHRAMLASAPPELAKALESVVPQSVHSTVWQFTTNDEKHTLELVKDNLTLLSRDYRRWEDFYGLFKPALDALIAIYNPPFFLRLGLRYRDVIQRSVLGLTDAPWTELLKREVLGELAVPEIEARTLGAARRLSLTLHDRDAKVTLQHGFAELEGSPEKVYLIDCDFFVERTETSHADTTLQFFHRNAASFFRWCITERLHQAMEPQPADA